MTCRHSTDSTDIELYMRYDYDDMIWIFRLKTLLPQSSRQTRRTWGGSRGASVSNDPALSISPWTAKTGAPSSGPQTFAIANKCKQVRQLC